MTDSLKAWFYSSTRQVRERGNSAGTYRKINNGSESRRLQRSGLCYLSCLYQGHTLSYTCCHSLSVKQSLELPLAMTGNSCQSKQHAMFDGKNEDYNTDLTCTSHFHIPGNRISFTHRDGGHSIPFSKITPLPTHAGGGEFYTLQAAK